MDKKSNNRSRSNSRLSLDQAEPSQRVMNRQIQKSAQPAPQNQTPAPAGQSFFQKVKQSLYSSIGNIVFGMEDGTVSIFGLVFGLASTAPNSHAVFLAGATGAAAAAVSMMAGTYLDVQSTKAKAQSDIEHERQEIQQNPKEEEKEATQRLRNANFTEEEVSQIMAALRNNPDALLKFETAYELQIGSEKDESPIVQSIWMFLADLIAASVPVIPFAFFALPTARLVSLTITGILMLLLGIARAVITKSNVWSTVLETLLIAGAAGAAGVFIGNLIGG
jgi:vacuolar iron transporter family protein